MPDDKSSVLITGANGFVGSRLCRKFLDEGFHVIAGVRKKADLSLLGELDIEYRYGDVTQIETLGEMVAGVDDIIHNAGVTKVKRKELFFTINHQGTKSLFEAIEKHNPHLKKAVYISSLAAAGPSTGGKPLTEEGQPHPITSYGQSKLAGERAALSFSNRFNVVAIRPPGIYGPGDKEILFFFEIVNKRIKPFIGSPERKLQLIHVDDLCRAVFLAVTNDTRAGEVYFVAENRSYSMRELIFLLEKGCGKKALPLRFPSSVFKAIAVVSELAFKLVGMTPMLTPEKANELLMSWEVSTAKAKRDFGFESLIPFEQGAKETYQWYRQKGWLK
jgi:nucleoside-diphosphate-sugar epimerase